MPCILPEKTKTEMISTRPDNSNKIHPSTAEKKGRVRGWNGEGLEGEGLEGKGVGEPGGGVVTQIINKAEEINLEKFSYVKAADLHHLS